MIRWASRGGDGGSRTHVRETDHSGIYMHSSFYDLDSIVAKGTTRKESSLIKVSPHSLRRGLQLVRYNRRSSITLADTKDSERGCVIYAANA